MSDLSFQTFVYIQECHENRTKHLNLVRLEKKFSGLIYKKVKLSKCPVFLFCLIIYYLNFRLLSIKFIKLTPSKLYFMFSWQRKKNFMQINWEVLVIMKQKCNPPQTTSSFLKKFIAYFIIVKKIQSYIFCKPVLFILSV